MGRVGGNPGNKGGGRHPRGTEMEFFKKLDKALPEVVDYCLETLQSCRINLLNKNLTITEAKMLQEIALKAAQILMNKAPQRVSGTGEGGAITLKIVQFANDK